MKRNNHNEALKKYDEAIKVDNNEYAISNKCLCLNKEKRFKESIETAEIGLKKVT